MSLGALMRALQPRVRILRPLLVALGTMLIALTALVASHSLGTETAPTAAVAADSRILTAVDDPGLCAEEGCEQPTGVVLMCVAALLVITVLLLPLVARARVLAHAVRRTARTFAVRQPRSTIDLTTALSVIRT